MKKIQKHRLSVQLLCLALTIVGFFTKFKATMLVILCLTLLSGVFYCGWICPYGFIQDLFSKLGELLGIKKKKMPIPIQKILVFSRYIIFVLIIFIGSDLIFSIMSFDPRSNFRRLLSGDIASIGAISVLFFFALISLFFERPFCNYLCYEGAKYGLMSSLRIFNIKRDESSCVNCKKCNNACPMNIEVSKCSNLRSPQCINCFKCISSCPVKDTLNYGKIDMTKKEKKRYVTVTTTLLVLITTFIGYNVYNGTKTLPSTPDNEAVTTFENVENSGDAANIPDGVYTGKGEGYNGIMSVEVTVKDQQITSIEVIKHKDDLKWFNRANSIMPNRIIEAQSTDVSVVSGATYSSVGIRDAVKDALEKTK